MAGLLVVAQTDEVATATTQKTMVQIIAPANQRLLVHEISISFDGTSNTAEPIRVQVVRQTSAGTATTLTLVKWNDDDTETIQTTATNNATVEPTSTDVVMQEQVHPQGGFNWQAQYGKAIVVPGGGRLAIAVKSGAVVNGAVRMLVEE